MDYKDFSDKELKNILQERENQITRNLDIYYKSDDEAFLNRSRSATTAKHKILVEISNRQIEKENKK